MESMEKKTIPKTHMCTYTHVHSKACTHTVHIHVVNIPAESDFLKMFPGISKPQRYRTATTFRGIKITDT